MVQGRARTFILFTILILSFYSIVACVSAQENGKLEEPRKIQIKEIASSPPPVRNNDYLALTDNKVSDNLKDQVQWNINWQNPYSNVELDMTLPEKAVVSKIAMHANQRISWDIAIPAAVKLSGSLDGKKWKELGCVLSPKMPGKSAFCFVLEVPPKKRCELRFIRALITPRKASGAKRSSAMCINEIEVYGMFTSKDSKPSGKLIKNYITNGSFETNNVLNIPDFWIVSCFWPYYDTDNMIKIYSDDKDAFSGRCSLCLDGSEYKNDFKANRLGIRQLFNLPVSGEKQKYTVSFYARSSDENVNLKVFFARKSYSVTLGKDWRRYQFQAICHSKDAIKKQAVFFEPFTLKKGTVGRLKAYKGGSKIWIDDVQLEKGDSANEYTACHLDLASLKLPEMEIAVPELNVEKINETLNLDGVLNENCYSNSKPFVENLHLLNTAEFARDKTVAYLMRDEKNLYICVKAFNSDGKPLKADAVKNDGNVYSDDAVELFIQPDSNRNEYFHYAINSIGTVFDCRCQYGKKSGFDLNWTSPFKYAVLRGKQEWALELAIPFEWLKSHSGDGDIRFNICRKNASWAPVQNGFHEPDKFGRIEGVDFLKVKPSIEFASIKVAYDLEKQENKLRISAKNVSESDIDFSVEAKIKSVETKKEKISSEKGLHLKAGGVLSFEMSLPGDFKDLYNIELLAVKKDNKIIGRDFQSVIFMLPLLIRTDGLVFKGENITASPKGFFEKIPELNAVLTFKNDKNVLVNEQKFSGLPENFKPIQSKDLEPGWFSMDLFLYKDGKELCSSRRKIYISEKVPSWSKIDSKNKSLIVNGRMIYPYGVYFHAADGMRYLKDNYYNVCMYRVWKSFDKSRCLNFLDSALKENISVFIDLTMFFRKDTSEKEFYSTLDEILNSVKKHPAYAGMHLCDEPNNQPDGLKSPESLRRVYQYLKEKDPWHISFFVVGGTLTYRYAFDAEDVICYDRYTTVTGPKTRNLRDNTFVLDVAINTAKFYNKALWRCLEGNEGAFPNLIRNPSTAEWKVLVFSTLASGGNGIMLWSGIPSFSSLQEAYRPVAKAFSETVPYFLKGKKSERVKLESPNLLWRSVDCDGKSVLLVVNLDYKKAECRFSCKGKINKIREITETATHGVKLTDALFCTELRPYDVKVFVIE